MSIMFSDTPEPLCKMASRTGVKLDFFFFFFSVSIRPVSSRSTPVFDEGPLANTANGISGVRSYPRASAQTCHAGTASSSVEG